MLLRRYASVVCVSEFVREQLDAQGTWSHLRRGTHFVNTARFAPDPAARERIRSEQQDDGRFVALVVAHLIREKGVDVAIRAIAMLPTSAVLWVIGDGPETGALQGLARALGVEDRVHWLGLKRNVAPFMQAADCLICPLGLG